MKQYFIDGKRASKSDFEGHLYLHYCIATKEERAEAVKRFTNGESWNGLQVIETQARGARK